MAPETTQIEHACGVSRINHQDHDQEQNGLDTAHAADLASSIHKMAAWPEFPARPPPISLPGAGAGTTPGTPWSPVPDGS